MTTFTITHPSGATVEVDSYGATVVCWTLPSGKQILYLSKLADREGKRAIRGGIPVVFPQFNSGIRSFVILYIEGPLVKHGFARTSNWMKESEYVDGEEVVCIMGMATDGNTKKAWNHEFALNYVIRLGKRSLSTQLMSV